MPVPDGPLLPLTAGGWSFSSIQHLGAEIHLIRDMMDPIHTGGLYDFLLTALEVRDRNALVAGQTPSPPQPPSWGWAHSHSRLACLRGRGPHRAPGPALVKRGRGGEATVHLSPGDPRTAMCSRLAVSLSTAAEGWLHSPAGWGRGGGMSWTHGGPGPEAGTPWRWAPEPEQVAGSGQAPGLTPPLSRQSCYKHIQKEDMHRLPSRWDSREPR